MKMYEMKVLAALLGVTIQKNGFYKKCFSVYAEYF